MQTVYYICKFSESWSIHDEAENKSRPLVREEIELVKKLFPGLTDSGGLLTAIEASLVNPKKLMQLGNRGPGATAKAKS